MAGIMTGMRVEGMTVIGAQPLPPSPATYRETRRRSHPQQLGAYGLIAAILLALLIGGVALRDRQGTRPVAAVTEHVNKAERQYTVAPTGSVPLMTEHINKAERQFAVAPSMEDVPLTGQDR